MNEEAAWLLLWNAGILIGLVGLPAMLGFFAGNSIDTTTKSTIPWRLVFAALGALAGAFAAWRTLIVRRPRRD